MCPVDSEHPSYQANADQWQTNRDALAGHPAIRAKRDRYLPVPPGLTSGVAQFIESGKRHGGGGDRYEFYLGFAEFPEVIAPAVNGFQGLVHEKPALVELPKSMEYLLEDATPDGETLDSLWERMTFEVLTTGRISLVCDVAPSDDTIRIATYAAERLLNWRLKPVREGGEPEFAVVTEDRSVEKEDDPFLSEEQLTFRELRVTGGVYTTSTWVKDENGDPTKEVDEEGTEDFVVSRIGTDVTQVPITVVNATTVGFEYGPIPITPLVRRALSIYRLTADYRRALYVKGDPQPWIAGINKDDAPTEIGGSTVWTFSNPQASAHYLDVDGKGIPLMREAIIDEYERFHEEGGKFLSEDNGAESGAALTKRARSKSVTLKGVIKNAGNAMERTLRKIAMVLNEDPEKVVFKPDTDWAEPMMTGEELFKLITAKNAGAPLSKRSLHDLTRRGGLTDMSFEDEEAEIEQEPPPLDGLTGLPPGGPAPPDEEEEEEPDEDEEA